MEDNGTQNSNIIMQTLLGIQNSIWKLNDDHEKINNFYKVNFFQI